MDSEQEQPTSQQHASTPGAALAAAREAMGLTVEQVADQLKLAPRQVQAIEQGNFDALPNRAVTRGFIRAYAKAMRLDPAPLVAMVEVEGAEGHATATVRPTRVQASFQESRFPSLTERNNGKPLGAIVAGAAVVALVGVAAAWQMGILSPLTLATRAGVEPAAEQPAAAEPPPLSVAQPGAQPAEAPLQSPNVPLISVPPQAGSHAAPAAVPGTGVPGATGAAMPPANAAAATQGAAGTAPAAAAPAGAAGVAPANRPAPTTTGGAVQAPANVPGSAVAPAGTGAAQVPAATAPANRPAPGTATGAAQAPAAAPGLIPAKPVSPGAPAAGVAGAAAGAAAAPTVPATAPAGGPAVGAAGGKLTLTFKEDSWVEIRRPGQNSLIARLVKAGSTETFNVREKDLLIVGKPGGVSASLAGAQLDLPQVPGGTISRVNIK